MEIAFDSSFKKAYNKKIKNRKESEELFWFATELFLKDQFHTSLTTHKLSGKLKGMWSFSIKYDFRIVFYFADNNTKIVFTYVGTHDEVY